MTVSNDIVIRLQDYFGRQIAWFEDIERELEEFHPDFDDDTMERFTERSAKREKERETFEKEFWALKHEWDATEAIAEADREIIAIIARQAGSWTEKLQTLFHAHADAASGRANQVRELVDEARRGRNLLDKYRPGDAPGGSAYVDQRA